jgi:dihydroorotate dehydrogenase electron transfer subunit
MTKIRKVKVESQTAKTVFFKDDACSKAEPGQFVMVWIPGVDEIPMSLSYIGKFEPDGFSAITVRRVGEATDALHRLKAGSLIGVRGPIGNWFKPVKGKVMLIGGGLGIAPLRPLIYKLKKIECEVTVIAAGKTSEDLVFTKEISKMVEGWGKICEVTEDGSRGFKGTATQALAEKLGGEAEKISQIYACGPEPMLVEVLDLSLKFNIDVQLSLERYVKCGLGICGSCMIGPYRICVDGPVFTGQMLRNVAEFGRFTRDSSGRRISI